MIARPSPERSPSAHIIIRSATSWQAKTQLPSTLRSTSLRRLVLDMLISPAIFSSLHLSNPKHIKTSFSGFSLSSAKPAKIDLINVELRSLSLRCDAQQLSDLAPAATASYGSLLLGGGLFAFSRSGSRGSVVGGLTGASILAVASYLMQAAETKPTGEAIAFGAAFLFSTVFGIRLAATRKVIPSGILLAISVGATTFFGAAYLQDKI